MSIVKNGENVAGAAVAEDHAALTRLRAVRAVDIEGGNCCAGSFNPSLDGEILQLQVDLGNVYVFGNII